MIKTKLKIWISDRRVNEWYQGKNIFFILAVGRSGTKFLSKLLDENKRAIVFHEPVPEDGKFNPLCIQAPNIAQTYIANFRKKYIFEKVRGKNITIYGEVNGRLRYMYDGLLKEFPSATFLHLVRDGRHVVRSIMARSHYKDKGHSSFEFYPREDEEYYQEWDSLDRFEKNCWFWMHGTKYLRSKIGTNVIMFEKLLSDYDYFKSNILEKVGIEISKSRWERAINKPINVTKRYTIPKWQEWPVDLIEKFDRICGDEMKENGYNY